MNTDTATLAVTTYADGYGAWHARLADTGSDARNRELARVAIASELRARDETSEAALSYLRVKLVRHPGRAVPGAGVFLTYVESWPIDAEYQA